MIQTNRRNCKSLLKGCTAWTGCEDLVTGIGLLAFQIQGPLVTLPQHRSDNLVSFSAEGFREIQVDENHADERWNDEEGDEGESADQLKMILL